MRAGIQAMPETIEISVRGKWVNVPALDVNGKKIIVKGGWIRLALIDAEEWLETDLEDPELCVARLKAQDSPELGADIFTFTQKLPARPPRFDYLMEWHSVAAARTTSFTDWWESLPRETRKNINRSQKRSVAVTVRELDDDLIRGLVDLNNDSPLRQGRRFTHYKKTFDQVKKDQASFPGRRALICAHLGEELIGFAKIVYRKDVASILQLLTKPSHNDKRPANALVAKAVELCEQKGFSHLTYGMFDYGTQRKSSLQEFKRRSGFVEILTPKFYVPLTGWGALALKLRLHRGLAGILPRRVIDLGMCARSATASLRMGSYRNRAFLHFL
jgi:hypothetical protein